MVSDGGVTTRHDYYLITFQRDSSRGPEFNLGLHRTKPGSLANEEALTAEGTWKLNDLIGRDHFLGSNLGHEIEQITTETARDLIGQWVAVGRLEQAPAAGDDLA